MLSPKTQYNLRNAKSYFEEHLCVGDYYSEGERVGGEWFGKGAELLGLSGAVRSAEFLSLCDNLDPGTGESLTVRQKTTRREEDADGRAREVANRRVFYDFTLSPPKSVSIVALVGGDDRIVKAHDHATHVALGELEKFAATRVRTAGAVSDRATSNVVAAVFRHDTSRALDPHYTVIASFSIRPTTPRRTDGRRCKTTPCSKRGSTWKTSITMSWRGSFIGADTTS